MPNIEDGVAERVGFDPSLSSANESGCCGNLREQREMASFVARFEPANRTREGRISASFDVVRVFLSARAQVGSVSQLLH
jgi:hypothetical protein